MVDASTTKCLFIQKSVIKKINNLQWCDIIRRLLINFGRWNFGKGTLHFLHSHVISLRFLFFWQTLQGFDGLNFDAGSMYFGSLSGASLEDNSPRSL